MAISKFRIGDVWLSEGGRRYEIVSHDPKFEYAWGARYVEEGYQYGKPAAFNDAGTMMDYHTKLTSMIERHL